MFKTLYKQIKSVLPREWKDNVLRHKRKYDAIVRGKIDIPVVVAVVGQACTYKCKDCGNFAPYAPKEFMETCKYCNGTSEKNMIPAAIQLEG